MTGLNDGARIAVLGLSTLTVLAGLALATSGYGGDRPVRRFHPTVSLTQCERAGGIVVARRGGVLFCSGGLDNGDPVAGE